MTRSHRFVLAGITVLAAIAAAGTASAGYRDTLKEALATANGKPVLVDFYTDW